MSAVTTYGSISPRTAAKATKKLLKRAQGLMVMERFGYFDPQPKKSSKTRKWRRYLSLPPALAPLAEGVPPTGHQLSYEDVSVNLEQYGDLVKITDVIVDTHEDNVLNEMIDICGEQAADTVEYLRINVVKAGSNVFRCGADSSLVASRALVNGEVSLNALRSVERLFHRTKSKPISKIVKASALISTEPVAPAFFALGHTDLKPSFQSMTGFTPVEKYSDAMKALPGEIGKVESTRVILTEKFEPWLESGVSGQTYLSGGVKVTSNAQYDVYPLIVLARESYGIVPLQGDKTGKGSMPVTPMVKNPGEPSITDPLGQQGFVSWKTWQACVILTQANIARVECCAPVLG